MNYRYVGCVLSVGMAACAGREAALSAEANQLSATLGAAGAQVASADAAASSTGTGGYGSWGLAGTGGVGTGGYDSWGAGGAEEVGFAGCGSAGRAGTDGLDSDDGAAGYSSWAGRDGVGASPCVRTHWTGTAGTSGADAGAGTACQYPYPATEWSPEPWVPVASIDAAELLAGVQAALPGHWQGLVSTPWTNPYRVEIRFAADGHYSSRCTEISSDCCLSFYYGTDDDTPLKQYRVGDATLSGDVFGEIDIAFGYGDEYGLPAWQGELSHIERDASGNGLRFEFQRSDGYGPLRYDLRRVPQD